MQSRLHDEFNDVYMQCIPEDTSAEEVNLIIHVVVDLRKRVQHQKNE